MRAIFEIYSKRLSWLKNKRKYKNKSKNINKSTRSRLMQNYTNKI